PCGRSRRLSARRLTYQNVEHHADVHAEISLGVHRTLRRQRVLAAVEVRTKRRTALIEPYLRCQAEELVSTAVRENGPVPAHEAVETPELLNCFGARSQCQVVRVAEQHRDACLAELSGRE